MWLSNLNYLRLAFSVPEVSTSVHTETSSSTAKSVAFGSEFATVTLFTVNFSLMFSAVGRIKSLFAEATTETGLVPFVASSDHFFSCIHRLAAFGAFWTFGRLEWHDDLDFLVLLTFQRRKLRGKSGLFVSKFV